jgi:hypothetical protein
VGNPYAPPEPGRPLPDPPPRPPAPARRRDPKPPLPPPDPAALRAASRLVLRFALLMLAGLLCLQLPVPWQAAGILFTGAGLVVGVVALRRVVRARLRSGLLVSLGLGLAMGSLMMLFHVALLAVWPAAFELQECRSKALTLNAEQACQDDYERWIRERSQFPTLDGSRG